MKYDSDMSRSYHYRHKISIGTIKKLFGNTVLHKIISSLTYLSKILYDSRCKMNPKIRKAERVGAKSPLLAVGSGCTASSVLLTLVFSEGCAH